MMKWFFLPVLLLAMTLGGTVGCVARGITPIAGGCTVEPMSPARIDELAAQAATPSALPSPNPTPIDVTAGQPVDDAVMEELNQIVREAQICAYQQDLPRLLSLYTDRFIVHQFFGTEPVSIVQTESGTPTDATPAPMTTDQEQFVMDAVSLSDGRIAATVSGNAWGGNPQLYVFVQHNGKWLIDEIGPVPNTGGMTNVTIPAAANAVVDLVLADAGQHLGVVPSSLSISRIEAVDWPDSSLGCPQADGVYAPVISPGYRIIVTDGATTLEYHTGMNNAFVLCAG